MTWGYASSGRRRAEGACGHFEAVEKRHSCQKVSIESPQNCTLSPGAWGMNMKANRRRRARSQAGFTLLDMMFVVALVGLLSSLALPGLMRARGAAQAASALGTIRVINSAELSFAITCGLGFYSADLPSLGIAPPASTEGFLPPDLSRGATIIRSGYAMSLAGTPAPGAPATCNGLAGGSTAPAYAAVADPLDGAVGRFFGTNSDGVIYEHSASLSAVMPETGAPPVGSPIK